MTDLAEVAASVAQALELEDYDVESWGMPPAWYFLDKDGSNLTDPYWIWRCVEWLLAHGYCVCFEPRANRSHGAWHEVVQIDLDCPAAEFPARAIHELMKERK